MLQDSRDLYLDLHARCNQAFTPFAPIDLPDFFSGRLEVIQRVRNELQAPGRHVAIFGERGVGKTSLARLLYVFTQFDPEKIFIVRCGEDSTFQTIFGELVSEVTRGLDLDSLSESGRAGLDFGAGPFKAGGERARSRTYRPTSHAQSISKGRLLKLFESAASLLVIDEYDRVQDQATHKNLAELIKAFSDARSTSKLVIVGVGQSITELIGEHESLSRSLAQIRLGRMSQGELMEIIDRGEKRTGIRFNQGIKSRIVALSDGFPHFVHLIGLYAALAALDSLNGRGVGGLEVGEPEYEAGVAGAVENSEYTLKEGYENAIVTTRRRSDIYELILQAIAMADQPVVQVRDIARFASILAGQELSPAKFSTALGRLTQDKGQVLAKVRDGYYRFKNPLMRAYVRLLLDQRYRGQLQLPFFQ